jgi:ParB-like chromosome segregation protein Spo0J
MPAKKSIALIDQALEAVIKHVEREANELPFPLNSATITYLPAMLVRPDPVQARRVLPEAIHYRFHEGKLTAVQALHELVRAAQLAARQHGRPFTNVIDLLADLSGGEDADSDTANAPKYTPEETLVRDLVTLAATLRDDGQINPLTVIDVSQGATRLFRIETGERRYWASWLGQEFLPGYSGDGTLPCVIIKNTQASVFRQARENTARAGLSAIAMARQAALLLMAVHGVPKPDYAVSNDFYRQALDLDLRDKREFTDAILTAMGGISRSYFSRLKRLLSLSDEAVELADRYELDEAQLRYVLLLAPEDHAEMIKQIIQFNLSMKQVKAMCEHTETDVSEDVSPPTKQITQIVRLLQRVDGMVASDIAHHLIAQEKDVFLARARIQSFRKLLDDVEQRIGTS